MAAARTIRPWDDRDQEERIARAFASDFIWSLTPAGSWLCETEGGKCYVVSAEHCSCPDYEHRCSKVGAKCKHQVALGHKLLAEGAAMLTPEPAEETFPCSKCGAETPPDELHVHGWDGEFFCRSCKDQASKLPRRQIDDDFDRIFGD